MYPDPRKVTAGELNFIDQKTRQLLVGWCDNAIREGSIFVEIGNSPYVRHALAKNWVSAKGNGQYRIVGGGWRTATSFLKR